MSNLRGAKLNLLGSGAGQATWAWGAVAVLVAAFGLAACGGSQKEPAAASDAEAPATEEAAAPEPPKAEESWGGEEAARDEKPAGDAATSPAPAGDAAPSGEAQSAPPATAGNAETRTTAVIAEVVNKNRAKVRACYDAVQKKLPDLSGDLIIKFTLDAEGKVKSAEQDLEKSTIKNAEVAKCAVDELKTWTFPPSSRGMDTTVNYPFNFKPKK
jgi:TonB family protein